MYNKIKEEDLKAILEVAKEKGISVIGHLRNVGALKAAELGIHCIEHGIGIPEVYLKEPLNLPLDYDDDDISQRFRSWQFVIWKNIDEYKAEKVMNFLIEKNVFVTSTLISKRVIKPSLREKELTPIWEKIPVFFKKYSLNPGIGEHWVEKDYENF